MLRSLSALAILVVLCGTGGAAMAQGCPEATIGVYFDADGNGQFIQPIQHQNLSMYIVLFAEAPVGGAAWRLEMTSPQYTDDLIGPPGPDCQPPDCPYQDPPFWYMGCIAEGSVVLGDPFSGVRQGFTHCTLGFGHFPILLATVILNPWADVLGSIEVDAAIVPEQFEGLVYALCTAEICDTVVGLPGHMGTTVIEAESHSWGSVKALFR